MRTFSWPQEDADTGQLLDTTNYYQSIYHYPAVLLVLMVEHRRRCCYYYYYYWENRELECYVQTQATYRSINRDLRTDWKTQTWNDGEIGDHRMDQEANNKRRDREIERARWGSDGLAAGATAAAWHAV